MSHDTTASVDAEIDQFLDIFNTTEEFLLDRFTYLEFTRSDANALSELSNKLESYKQEINGAFLGYLNSAFKEWPLVEAADKNAIFNEQVSNFNLLIVGSYDVNYVRRRIAIGITYYKLGLPINWYFAAYSKYKSLLNPIIWKVCDGNLVLFTRYKEALSKIIFFDIGIALDAHLYTYKSALSQIRQEHSQHEEQLYFQKNYDSLTGLPNRDMLKKQLAHFLEFAENKDTNITLIKLGLDHFKILNDGEGYDIGDQILKAVGVRLHGYAHNDDLVAYWGGDAFSIVLTTRALSDDVSSICNEINEVIRVPFLINDKKIHLTCSMGIALYPQDCQSVENLIKFSSTSMDQAKEMGGNRYQFFNKKLDASLMERTSIANELYNAIESNQFCLYYHPVADLQSGKIVSMEALVRWIHPERGVIPPNQFINIAEGLPLINKLGDWIIRRACNDIRHWRAQGINVPRIAINVSPKQLQEPMFTHNLLSTLAELDIDPHWITLEITESLLMQHSDTIEAILKEFKAQGLCISMDDFGTGYSALSYLKHYPFDYVKIDQSFVHGIIENSGDAAIANAVISMAHSMGIKVIAEGVETEAQCEFLSKNMCDYIQGYYLAQPMPLEQAGAYITQNYELPEHLRRIMQVNRTLLLVDDEPNILSALKRLVRQDGYKILLANSGLEALEILKEHKVDVIISDQRMPVMTGVEFFRQAKVKYPDTIRIVLSGYTELQSITDAINEGSIYKFLTKPWDDGQLRDQISDAFRQKEMSDENRQLSLRIQTANLELATVNRHLAEVVQLKEKQIYRDETSLDIAREALQHIPIPMLGIDDDGMIAFANFATEELLFENVPILGTHIEEILPGFNSILAGKEEGINFSLDIVDFNYLANWRTMGERSKSRGKLITFFKEN